MADPKPLPKIDIKLIESIKVKKFSNCTVKDLYSSILKNSHGYTTDIDDYEASLIAAMTNDPKDNFGTPKSPKFYVAPDGPRKTPTLTCIGNAMICTPETPNFEYFPASLKNDHGGFAGEVSFTEPANSPGWIDSTCSDGSYTAKGRRGNLLNDNGSGQGTDTNNVWIPYNDGNVNELSGFYEADFGIVKDNKSKITEMIKSEFSLERNQPFSFKFRLYPFTPEQKAILIAEAKSAGAGDLILAATPSVDIHWGQDNVLTYFNTGKIRLRVNGKQIGNIQTLPNAAFDQGAGSFNQITIYPLGNCIYVYSGVPTTEATIKGQFICFNLKELVFAARGEIVLVFKCGAGYFNFSPVVHRSSGSITSPYISGGYDADRTIAVVGFLGKYGVGARENPIKFPDINDTDQFFDYLEPYGIDVEVNRISQALYNYTLQLTVPNSATDLDALNETLQTAHKDVMAALNANLAAVAAGTKTTTQAATATKAQVSSSGNSVVQAFQNFSRSSGGATSSINGQNFNQLMVGMFGKGVAGDGSGQGSGSIGGSGSYDSLIDDMFGLGTGAAQGSGAFTSAGNTGLKRNQNAMNKGMAALEVKFIGRNIYSPAVFYTQITLVKDLETVDLAPNPQIDNCDVMEFSVNQAVEHSTASIVLNNREDCETASATAKGKYTFIQGTNNFTGIKPIQVKAGYDGDTELSTVFTGFVSTRRYNRTSNNDSTCGLECEDMSKKAKEQFAINLPFFDGWCHLAVIYYLGKEAGFTDDEILLFQDPVTGRKERVVDYLTGDKDTFTGGCFDGHADDKPRGGLGLQSQYLHMTLPLAILGVDEPNYNFTMGTPLWACMMRIREFTNFYLYANNFGNIIYGPPKRIVQDSGKTFVEVDTVGAFNEIRKQLSVTYDTAQMRNSVFLQGLTFLRNPDGKELGTWAPHVHIKTKPNFPKDIDEPSFAPWLRHALLRDPKYEFPNLARLAADEMFRRVTRQIIVADFTSWGHPTVFPYQYLEINESQNNETGVNGKKFIIGAHTITGVAGQSLESKFSTESFDSTLIDYDPQLPPSIRD